MSLGEREGGYGDGVGKMGAKSDQIEELKGAISALRDQIRQQHKADLVGIFGSYARGEQREGSDLDILVDFRQGADLLDLVGLGLFLEEKLGVPVDIVPRDALRPEIRERVLAETLYL